jgi:hypothetical protein
MFGLPTPRVQAVRQLGDILSLRLYRVKHGWTIRTCRRDGRNEFDLFYRNRVPETRVGDLLTARLREHGDEEFYVLYPSWSFLFSCNVVLINSVYFFEGTFGSQKLISSGVNVPEFGFSVPFGFRSKRTGNFGDVREDVVTRLGRLLFYLKKLPLESFYAEVACTRGNEYFFYELWRVPEVIRAIPRRDYVRRND